MSITQSNVFTKDLIETWIAYKREREADPIRIPMSSTCNTTFNPCCGRIFGLATP